MSPGADGVVNMSRLTISIWQMGVRVLCLWPILLGADSALAGRGKVDPRELVGKEVAGSDYPSRWMFIGTPFYDDRNKLDGVILIKGGMKIFVLERVLALRTELTQRKSLIVDAVSIKTNPDKVGQSFIRDCQYGERQPGPDEVIFAEVRFKRCERYSSRVLNAWLIDMNAEKIRAISPKGIRCVDVFFNSGEGDRCPPVPTEW